MHLRHKITTRLWLPVILCVAVSGCSLKQTTVGLIGDAVTGGPSVYASDEDPELVKEALPFGLKTFEGLLQVTPDHRGLLLASARGFTAYAYLLQWQADRTEADDLAAARQLRGRARALFLRARDYAFRGLETNHPNFHAALLDDPAGTLAGVGKDDIAFLYWGGAAWAGALSAARDDLALIGELPFAGAMVARVNQLDDRYDDGAAHEFFVAYEASRPGGSAEAALAHYRKAVAYSHGTRAGAHLALAETVAVRRQDLAEFRRLLAAAAAVDVDAAPQRRLVNTVAQQRARWLAGRIPDLFVLTDEEAATQ